MRERQTDRQTDQEREKEKGRETETETESDWGRKQTEKQQRDVKAVPESLKPDLLLLGLS